MSKTFYLETFGCQMNAHDSEKVVGTLQREGYTQVAEEIEADLILYNTCSIRDKAEQKVFNRLNDYKKLLKQGKRFGVLGCVAQQEGEKIFERAPWVSLVCGSASYRKLPDMLAQLERIVPRENGYRHGEGNSQAHILSVMLSTSINIPIRQGKLALGKWQGVMFVELDGPRDRKIIVSVVTTSPVKQERR